MLMERCLEYYSSVKTRITQIILVALICLNPIAPQQQAHAEVCPTYDAQKLFDSGYYDAIWVSQNITWTFESRELPSIGEVWGETGAKILRAPSETEKTIIEEAFKNWDRALYSRTFQFTTSTNADIKVGFTERPGHPWFFRYSTRSQFPPRGNLYNGVIGFTALDTTIVNEGYFSALVHRRIANILGMGFILDTNTNPTVMKGLFQDLYDKYSGDSLKNEGARYVPSDFEIGLIRSLYGETTCPSTFGKKFDEEREKQAKKKTDLELARKAFEDAKARADSEAKSNAEAKAALDLEAKVKAEAKVAADTKAVADKIVQDAKLEAEKILAAAKATATTKTTITCTKGKLIKRVTAVKPKCPSGYKVKK